MNDDLVKEDKRATCIAALQWVNSPEYRQYVGNGEWVGEMDPIVQCIFLDLVDHSEA